MNTNQNNLAEFQCSMGRNITVDYAYSCVGCPDLSELEYIIEHERSVSYRTFRLHIGAGEMKRLNDMLGYTGSGLSLASDWAVSFHKSKTPDGKTVYYMRHSAIEYVYY